MENNGCNLINFPTEVSPVDIVIYINGGMIQEIRANKEHVNVLFVDRDCQLMDDDAVIAMGEALRRGRQPDMYTVYPEQ